MTILHIHENVDIRGGSEVYIRDVMEELYKRGIGSIFLVVEKVKSHYKVYVNRILVCDIHQRKLTKTLTDILKDYRIDIAHIHGITDTQIIKYFLSRYKVIRMMHEPRLVCPGQGKFWAVQGKPCKKKYGLHCLFHAYSQRCLMSRMPLNVVKSYLNTQFEVKTASYIYKAIVVMSIYIKSEAIKAGIPAEKIILNPYFTKFKLPFSPFESKSKHFLFIGRLAEYKGVSYLLNAMYSILNKYNDVYLNIVGDGFLYSDIETFIFEKQLEGRIILEKWKSSEEISQLMKESYCILFPSIYPEAFGLVGIEAAMHSKPVIAFNSGGISTWLINDYNGYLLDEISVTNFSRSIEQIINIPLSDYCVMSKNAWEYANLHFTPQRHIDMLIDSYKKCMEI
jgi:glycosyltransferase involved in cell wall biosynthesis